MSVNKVLSNGSLSKIATRGQFIQFSVMPTASADRLNQIVQFIGTTTANYTNGYFYQCNEISTGVYGWVRKDIQPSSGGGSAEIIKGYFNPTDNLFYEESTYVTPIAGDVNSLYLSLDTDLLYRYNSTIFVEIGNYEIGDGLNLDGNVLSADTVTFIGTSTEWNNLTTAEKIKYDICNITDDADSDAIYTKSEIDAMLGTAASKDYTDVVRPNDHDLVESNAVYSAINGALSSVYVPHGDLTCAELTSALLIASNVGNVYQMSDSGTTSNLFINGAGITINTNDSVGIIRASANDIMFNYMGNVLDLHEYQTKDLVTPITIGGTNRTTVESALGALNDVDATKMSYTDNGILGAKNLTPSKEISQTRNGIVFTVNSDGTVILNQTADNTTFRSTISGNNANNIKLYLKAGTYIYSLCDTNISGVSIVVKDMNNVDVLRSSTLTGASFTLSEDKEVTVDWRIETGTSFSNTVFKAMLRYAFDTDPTYQPYSMTNQQMTPYVQSISNPNLLDNPWFTINQRGLSSYTSGYTVDRWKKQAGTGTITVTENGLTIEPTTSGSMLLFRQQLDLDTVVPYILGKQVTLSIMLSDGKIYSTTGVLPNALTSSFVYRCFVRPDGDSVNTFVIQLKSGDCSIQYYNEGSVIPSNIITVRAVKLELGSVSTLAMDVAPNYASELQRCQRYFRAIPVSELIARVNNGGNRVRFMSLYLENMRGNNPTVSINYGSLTHQLYVNGGGSEILLDDTTDYTVGYEGNSRSMVLILTSSGQTKLASLKSNVVGVWRYGNTDDAPRIYVSADL